MSAEPTISDVRIKLVLEDPKLKAFCSFVYGNMLIRDCKIIESERGLFVAMPSRKSTVRCTYCAGKCFSEQYFCGWCGKKLRNGGFVGYSDIAHPINSDCRKMIQERVLAAYEEALRQERVSRRDLEDVLVR